MRLELMTPCLQGRCSPNWAIPPCGLKHIGLLNYQKQQFLYFFIKSGSHLLSRVVSNQVPSAAHVLTYVFGMGTSVSHERIATRNFASIHFSELEDSTVKEELL